MYRPLIVDLVESLDIAQRGKIVYRYQIYGAGCWSPKMTLSTPIPKASVWMATGALKA